MEAFPSLFFMVAGSPSLRNSLSFGSRLSWINWILEEISVILFHHLRKYFSFLVSPEGRLILHWVNILTVGDKCCWRGLERVDDTWVRRFGRWDWSLVSFPPLFVFALSDYGSTALWDKTERKITISVGLWKSHLWSRLRAKQLVFVAFSRPCGNELSVLEAFNTTVSFSMHLLIQFQFMVTTLRNFESALHVLCLILRIFIHFQNAFYTKEMWEMSWHVCQSVL